MSEYFVIGVFWIACLYAIVRDLRLLFLLFFCSLCFGSFTVVPVSLTGGLTITPTSVLSLALVARLLMSFDGINFVLQATASVFSLRLLKIYCIVAVITTLFMSRLFQDHIYVYSLRNVDYTLLKPTSQNITQLAYVILSCSTAVALARLYKEGSYLLLTIIALCSLALLLGITGLLDNFHVTSALSPFRNGSYIVHAEHNVLGAKRIIGLMPEASSYATLCVSVFVILFFLRKYCPSHFTRNYLIPVCLIVLGVCIWYSASSTGFIGVIVFLLVIILSVIKRVFTHLFAGVTNTRKIGNFLGAVLIVASIAMFGDWVLNRMQDALAVLDLMLFKKIDSESYLTRSAQNMTAWRAFIDSHLLGIGLGSTRTSSSILAVVSGVGLLGAVALYSQLILLGIKPAGGVESQTASVSVYRKSMMPIFVMSAVSSSVADFGPLVAFLIAFSVASRY